MSNWEKGTKGKHNAEVHTRHCGGWRVYDRTAGWAYTIGRPWAVQKFNAKRGIWESVTHEGWGYYASAEAAMKAIDRHIISAEPII